VLFNQFYREFAPVRRQVSVAIHADRREFGGVILGIHFERQAHTVEFDVGSGDFGFLSGPREGWQEHGRQQGDDRYNHEEFDQGEGPPLRWQDAAALSAWNCGAR
jgi:hypothetical protein